MRPPEFLSSQKVVIPRLINEAELSGPIPRPHLALMKRVLITELGMTVFEKRPRYGFGLRRGVGSTRLPPPCM